MEPTQNAESDARGNQDLTVVLEPNPPLQRRTMIMMMIGIGLFSLVVCTGFLLAGAWPVVGFMGLELVIFVAAFAMYRRRALQAERVVVNSQGLQIDQKKPCGAVSSLSFSGHWAQAVVADEYSRTKGILVLERGHSFRFAEFLNRHECVSLAKTINKSLQEFRVRV